MLLDRLRKRKVTSLIFGQQIRKQSFRFEPRVDICGKFNGGITPFVLALGIKRFAHQHLFELLN